MNAEGLARSGANLAVRLATQRGELESQAEEVKKLYVFTSSIHCIPLGRLNLFFFASIELRNWQAHPQLMVIRIEMA